MAFDVDGARCVKLLVDAGADVNVRDAFGEGQTPLWYAAYNSSFAIVCTLVEANAEIDNPKYNTPMYVAAEFGFVENVEYLLARGRMTQRKGFPDATILGCSKRSYRSVRTALALESRHECER